MRLVRINDGCWVNPEFVSSVRNDAWGPLVTMQDGRQHIAQGELLEVVENLSE